MLKEKNYYCSKDMVQLDQERDFIPLTMNKMFKGIFKKNESLLKNFILNQIGLELDEDMYDIDIIENELDLYKLDKGLKTIKIFVTINNLNVRLEVNSDYFKNIDISNFIYDGEIYKKTSENENKNEKEKKFIYDKLYIQIFLNTMNEYDEHNNRIEKGTEKVVFYGLNSGEVYESDYTMYSKDLKYYRDLYYNNTENLDKSSIWLVLLTSTSFIEMYNILGELFNNDVREQIINDIIYVMDEEEIITEWKKYKLYLNCKSKKEVKKIALKEGYNIGYEKGIKSGKGITSKEHIIKMLEMNLNIEDISKITNKTEEEILKIKNNFINSNE